MRRRPARRGAFSGTGQAESGMALLAVLLILLAVAASSSSFIWFMHQQQTRAGGRLRGAAALSLAEAGVHRALSVLETMGGDGVRPGRWWRPGAYTEARRAGGFDGRVTLSIADDAGSAVIITSTGEVGGVRRRLRVRATLTSPALLAAIYGASFVRLEEPPASTVVLSYGGGLGDRSWIHLAAGRQLWFGTTDVSINDPSAAVDVGPGPIDAPRSPSAATRLQRAGPIRVLLARDADLALGPDRRRVDVHDLRALGVYIEGVVLHAEALPAVPDVDRDYYRWLAAGNTRNAALNQVAGEYLGDDQLARKTDSAYSSREVEQILTYLRTGLAAPRMRGVVYVDGGVALLDGQTLRIIDGGLITEGTVRVGQGGTLEITHSAATRSLPGLIALERGAILINQHARLRVHGLVYASRVFEATEGARVDVVGSVLGRDAGLSLRNHASTVVVRYDPAVLGTPGLRVADADPVIAWVSSWQELP